MVRRISLGLVSAVAFLSAANAADIYRAPEGGYKDAPVYAVNTWTGFYIGANGGYAFNNDSKDIELSNNLAVMAHSKGLEAEGGFGGGQIGYNWQGGVFGPHIVFGVEADIQGSDISDNFNRIVDAGGDNLKANKNIDYFGTVRGRIGYAFDKVLVYGTGGFAYGNVRSRLLVSNGGSSADLKRDETETGYAVGGGLEYKIAPAWSLKVEYQYIDLGSEKLAANVVPPNGISIRSNDLETNFSTVRAGINYHFHDDYIPLK